MTGPMTPFDHRPDARLGEALRAALDPGDQAAFVARVLAAAARPARTVDVLAAWARRGLVAAMAAAAVAGFLVGRGSPPTSSPEDALAPASWSGQCRARHGDAAARRQRGVRRARIGQPLRLRQERPS